MKKLFSLTLLILVISFVFSTFSFVSSASSETNGGHTEKEEVEGKIFWGKLQAKEINCEGLSDDNFHSLGMYFMGLMTGKSHETMDTMMEKMMGEDGEKQMHVAMGKRMSGCEPNAPMPQGMTDSGMMNMMMGGEMMGENNSMMGNFGTNSLMGWFGFGFGWILMILFWGLAIVGIVTLIKWLTNQSRNTHDHEKSPLEILKERYAKGEIDKKELEEKKKDLS